MTPRFSIFILHNDRSPERAMALRNLKRKLVIDGASEDSICIVGGPGPENAFNERRWRAALASAGRCGETHAVFLDDDVNVCDQFVWHTRRIIAAKPDSVIALHTALPEAISAHARGERWLTTDDGILGPANIWPIPKLREFMAWRASSALVNGTIEASAKFGSDVLMGLFCSEMGYRVGYRVHHPLPTLVRHDLSLATSFPGNENTPGRQTTCSFADVALPDSWEQSAPVRHIGGWFKGMDNIRRAYLTRMQPTGCGSSIPVTPAQPAERPEGAGAVSTASSPVRSGTLGIPPHVFIALPTYGGIEVEFLISLIALLNHLTAIGVGYTLGPLTGESLITRGRNLLAHRFYEGTPQATGMIFLDVDLKFEPETVADLVLSGLDVVAAPYPVKSLEGRLACGVAEFEAPGDPGKRQRKTATVGYSDGRKRTFVQGRDLPTGCLYISRHALDVLAPHVGTFEWDMGTERPTVRAFFDTMIEAHPTKKDPNARRFLSEDYTFARLCQFNGIDTWLDCDAKLGHVGKYMFTGPSLREQWEKEKTLETGMAASDSAVADGTNSRALPPGGGSEEPGISLARDYGASPNAMRWAADIQSAMRRDAARVDEAWRRPGHEPLIAPTGFWYGPEAAAHHACDKGLAEWLAGYLDPKRQVYDFGCGLGTYLAVLRDHGFRFLVGYDGAVLPRRDFGTVLPQDLTQPFRVVPGDVVCLEVAEHVPAEFESTLLDNICGAVEPGGKLVLSWAVRGQGGAGHVNCRNNDEVLSLIHARGFDIDNTATLAARAAVSNLDWFRNTLMVFTKHYAAAKAAAE